MTKIYTFDENNLNLFLQDNGIIHFTAKELCTMRNAGKYDLPIFVLAPMELWNNIVQTCKFLENLRNDFGAIKVISGYRTKEYNTAVGGAKDSQHMHFRAIDSCPVNGQLLSEYKKACQEYHKTAEAKELKHGYGLYSWGVHNDFGFSYRNW